MRSVGGGLSGEGRPLWEAQAQDEDLPEERKVALQWTLGSHTAVS